jgi:hypothetical protein
MIAFAGLAASTVCVLAGRYFLNVQSNLILPNKVSHYKDSAIIMIAAYIALTAICGFIKREHRKIEKAELITNRAGAI